MIRAALAVLLLILAPIAQADTTWTIEAHDVDRVYDGVDWCEILAAQ